ncbi:SH3 domain-containing protein [Paraburkholderia ginsengisoli]|uniref:SH3 domain-containing protein n=1 Tax=Paraburkholderia ginsengisoli TaxID=311231 RepID=A0A7T4T8Q5_9BURK|nr:SH3 domain-containing protein [Paraburkholderia ginsengisoli]QQC64185.1 SH3 domain-containing protein [Paraburkholderia ginsengisoli]
MKQHLVRCLYMAAGLLALPGAADAQSQAFTSSTVNVRAGPASDYPIVAQLPGGVPVTVMGCLSNYQWCDVAAPNLRGWVYASRLSSPYQGGNVPLMNYGTVLGLPILGFSIADYWGNYYRGRPWYNQQSRWSHHAPPPPPRPGAGRPPGGHQPGHPGGPPPGHAGGRPPGGPPPGHTGGGRPPGGQQQPGNAGTRPPGGQSPGNAGGRPPGGQQQPGNAGTRPPGGQSPGNAGGRPPGGGQQGGAGGRPPSGESHGGGNRPPQGGGGGGGGGGGHPPGGNNN